MFPSQTFVFDFDEGSNEWLETTVLPVGQVSGGSHAQAATIHGDIVIIGQDTSNPHARIFQRLADGTWVERDTVFPEPNPWSHFYGQTVSTDGERVIIGAFGEDQQQGAAYIYDLHPKIGDLDCDGVVGVADLLILLAAFGNECKPPACHADLTGSGQVGVPDLLVLLANWG